MLEGREEGRQRIIHFFFFFFKSKGNWVFPSEKTAEEWGFLLLNNQKVLGTLLFCLSFRMELAYKTVADDLSG